MTTAAGSSAAGPPAPLPQNTHGTANQTSPPTKRDLKSWWKSFKLAPKQPEQPGTVNIHSFQALARVTPLLVHGDLDKGQDRRESARGGELIAARELYRSVPQPHPAILLFWPSSSATTS
jgi:hypothetical protein